MQVEVWKPIPNYEGLYEVSNLGRIRSLYNYRKYNVLTQMKAVIIPMEYENVFYFREINAIGG